MFDDHVYLDPIYRDMDLRSACLFTGVNVEKTKGEHVIPLWMQKQYRFDSRYVEMGEGRKRASILRFRAPAVQEANEQFGALENRVKIGTATKDELHLWCKKLSVGMIWNHHCLSQNIGHPQVPDIFDDRRLRIALMNFHKEFAEFRAGSYSRSGSTLILPTKITGCWFVHAFGEITNGAFSETHDAICPYALVAVSHAGNLIVSALHDTDRTLESGRLLHTWTSTGLHECEDDARIRAGLAVVFAEDVVGPAMRLLGQSPDSRIIELIAFQMGIVLVSDQHYRKRNSTDLAPPPIVSSR